MVAVSPTQSRPTVEFDDAARALLDESADRCIAQFIEWLVPAATARGRYVQRIAVNRWESREDPDWVEVVILVVMAGRAGEVLDFGAEAGEMLEAVKERTGSPRTQDLLFVRFDWQ
jgi:hypothetical protein